MISLSPDIYFFCLNHHNEYQVILDISGNDVRLAPRACCISGPYVRGAREPGYAKRLFYYFTASEIEKVCPTATDLTWRIGNEAFYNLLCVLLTLLFGYAPLVGKIVKEKCSAAMSMFREWRARK
ncbi:uncharacterized protein LOC110447876 [Mizuhopecten yessoensis]|uniref:uncharacterized protein LOC110447876 n=1 Tax=Mizuhopecten yessoensis TaxID=6573 RepID=UPI000B45E021|nr:uncharacterized protein LOC110447876 [Mizuhopecten yessoensis]